MKTTTNKQMQLTEMNQREVLLHFTIVLSLLYQVTGIGQKPKILGKKNLLYFRSFRPRHKNTVSTPP